MIITITVSGSRSDDDLSICQNSQDACATSIEAYTVKLWCNSEIPIMLMCFQAKKVELPYHEVFDTLGLADFQITRNGILARALQVDCVVA